MADRETMNVRVLINGEKPLTLELRRDDPQNPNQYVAFEKLGDAELHVGVFGNDDGDQTEVHFDLSVEEEVVEHDGGTTAIHEVGGSTSVEGPWDWKSHSWTIELPTRPNFPGEPPLPRTTIEVTLELEEALVPA